MLDFLQGCWSGFFLVINTAVFSIFIFILAILKWCIPLKFFRSFCNVLLGKIAQFWVCSNNLWMRSTKILYHEDERAKSLHKEGWYLVVANHQSWADIHILQRELRCHIPFLKFFIKQQLLFVPVIGICWWALDFPIMRRHSRAYLKRHPKARGQDLETTKKACEKFQHMPTAIVNFIESTRFSVAKSKQQGGKYRYVLKPKAGGIAFVLSTLGDCIQQILDVTIVYAGKKPPTYWDFLCGKVNKTVVSMRVVDIPEVFLQEDLARNMGTQKQFHTWVNRLWLEKDKEIQKIRELYNIPL